MTEPIRIDPTAFYDAPTLHLRAGFSLGALDKARKSGALRSTRRSGTTLFLGQWLLDWLLADDESVSMD